MKKCASFGCNRVSLPHSGHCGALFWICAVKCWFHSDVLVTTEQCLHRLSLVSCMHKSIFNKFQFCKQKVRSWIITPKKLNTGKKHLALDFEQLEDELFNDINSESLMRSFSLHSLLLEIKDLPYSSGTKR